MTTTARIPNVPRGGQTSQLYKLEQTWKERLERAKEARKIPERTILSDLAFAAGQQWLVYDDKQRRMRHIAEMDSRYADRELYTADRIREYRAAQLGELNADSELPKLLAAQEGDQAEDVAHELNQAARYGWEHEWKADDALRQARRFCVDMGVAAIRCQWDPAAGPTAGHIPVDSQGQPVTPNTHPDDYQALSQVGAMADGSLPQFKEVKEGRTSWVPLTALHLLPPPGISHERDFPHFAICRPVPIDTLTDLYGELATAGLTEDVDIASLSGIATGQQAQTGQAASSNRLRGHVWLYTCFDLPSGQLPNGRVTLLASNQYRLITSRDQLDYQLPDKSWHTGVVFLHWERHSDRFWSRSFINPLKDPQRIINRRKTQNVEIIDRAMPKTFIEEGSLPENPDGLPWEIIELKSGSAKPDFFDGAGPGPWMYEDIASLIDDLAHASTLSALRLGENPANVQTFSQLSLLNENEVLKRSEIRAEHEEARGQLVMLSMADAARYWPDEKMLLVDGEQDQIRQTVFRKSMIPPFFMVRIARGTSLPNSQAAEIQKVDAIWQAALSTGVAVQPPVADKWTRWYADSYEAGKVLPLPSPNADAQADVAEFENFEMLQGEQPVPAEYDNQPVHIPIHREALDQARASGDMQTAARLQQHITDSIRMIAFARKAWRTVDPSDLTDQASDMALDEDQALRENQMLIQGVPLNAESQQQAFAQIQHGLNPETGQPVTVNDNIQELLLRASLQPTMAENLELHLDRHGKLIKSPDFRSLPPDAQHRVLLHFELTREMWLHLPMMPQQIEAPRVSLQLRESVGPSTIAKVLARAGVPEADPNELATEPPMENMVQATVNEPDPQKPQQPAQPQQQSQKPQPRPKRP